MLERSRVVLRTPTAADEEEFIVRMRASRRLHHPWLYPPLTPDAYRAYLERIDDERKVGYLACRREDGAIAGWLNVSEIVRGEFQSAYLGYGGVAEFAGQGYMTEALEWRRTHRGGDVLRRCGATVRRSRPLHRARRSTAFRTSRAQGP